jgi:hypothetical protein
VASDDALGAGLQHVSGVPSFYANGSMREITGSSIATSGNKMAANLWVPHAADLASIGIDLADPENLGIQTVTSDTGDRWELVPTSRAVPVSSTNPLIWDLVSQRHGTDFTPVVKFGGAALSMAGGRARTLRVGPGMVDVKLAVFFTVASPAASGILTFDAPIPPRSPALNEGVGSFWYVDAGNIIQTGFVVWASATSMTFYADGGGGTIQPSGGVQVNDQLGLSIQYEPA